MSLSGGRDSLSRAMRTPCTGRYRHPVQGRRGIPTRAGGGIPPTRVGVSHPPEWGGGRKIRCRKDMKIGILGFQGAIIEHERHVAAIGAEPVIVRYREQLPELDGIILPGGESTTMGKLLNRTGMMEPLRDAIAGGLPAWGTCAGMILLAKRLENDPARYLALMDITVRRNAYGRQIDSFSTSVEIPEVGTGQLPLVFIRAPYITETGAGVQVLCRLDGHVVAAREGNLLATSFHPELTDSNVFHRYFAGMCEKSKNG